MALWGYHWTRRLSWRVVDRGGVYTECLLFARTLSHLIFATFLWSICFILTKQMKKVKFQQVKWLGQGHTVASEVINYRHRHQFRMHWPCCLSSNTVLVPLIIIIMIIFIKPLLCSFFYLKSNSWKLLWVYANNVLSTLYIINNLILTISVWGSYTVSISDIMKLSGA